MKNTVKIIIPALLAALCLTAVARTPHRKSKTSNTATTAQAPRKNASHQSVDLGLGVEWATTNLGASSPSDLGNYYAWGEVKPKKEYTEENCLTWNQNFEHREICGDTIYDAATVAWGKEWRLPTADEMNALLDSCTWTLTRQGNHKGYKVTGPNGKSIFLPLAGVKTKSTVIYDDLAGYYWTSTPVSTRLAANLLLEEAAEPQAFNFHRATGLSIRPVKNK